MTKHFSVDARAMLTWGRESIKDHTTAVLELVKNSYDANATVVEVEIKTHISGDAVPHVRVADNGVGMSAEDVEHHWLRLGYSAKRDDRFTARGRRKTGEKGVGRISADRLGAILELRSRAKAQSVTGLCVRWNEFEKPGQDLQKVPVYDLKNLDFKVPQPSPWNRRRHEYDPKPEPVPVSRTVSGTELIIRELRQSWNEDDVQELRRLLSLLTPPFERVEDFQIRIDNDVDPTCNGVVTSPLLASAAIEARFHLDAKGKVTGKIIHRAPSSTKRISKPVNMPFKQLVHQKPRAGVDPKPDELVKQLGPVDARLLFYPQKAETVRGLDLDLSDLREFLQTNAGIRVYRDSIRVPPFGDQGRPEGDWLALGDRKARNPAGPNRPDFRVSPYQLVGGVFIGRDTNPGLIDTSGREGLVNSEAFSVLKSFLIGCLTQLETHYHKLFVSSKPKSEPLMSPRDTVDELRVQISDVVKTIKRAVKSMPQASVGPIAQVAEQLTVASEKLKQASKTFDELASQTITSRTLATIGIASATFGHETQRGLDSMRATLEAAKLLLANGEDDEAVLSELAKAILESERVSAWGEFALGRVRRDKRVRRVVDIESLVGDLVTEINPAMEASSITLKPDLEAIHAKVFAMDVECVAINLLTNAYYFTKQSSRERQIVVRVRARNHDGRRGFDIVVSDSGPGIAESIRERIWDPLFTTKTDEHGRSIGTGLGLALVNAVVQDTEGSRAVDDDPKLGGARFTVWLPDAGA